MLTSENQTADERATPAGRIWGRGYRRLTFGLLLIITSAAYEALAVATVMPATALELGGLNLYGWAFSAFMLANLFGAVLAGTVIDRSGAMRPFVAGAGLFVLGLALAGLASSMLTLIVGRAVQGLGAGMLSAVAYAVIARGYPAALRPRMLALTSTAWVVPGLIGPALAGVIADLASWRWVFLSVLPLPPIAVLCALPALRAIGPTGATAATGERIRLAGLLAVGAGLLTAGLGVGSLPLGATLLVAGLALALPALRRLMPPGTLRAAPGLPTAILLMGLLNLVFFGVDAFVPLVLNVVRGQSAALTGLALTAATMTWTAGAWLQAAWVGRVSRGAFVAVGLMLVALGSGGIIAVADPRVPVLLATLAWAVAGFGIGIAYASCSLAVLDEAPPGRQGESTASMQLATMLGTALGTGLGGVLVAAAATPGLGVQLQSAAMIGLALLGVALAGRLGRGARAE